MTGDVEWIAAYGKVGLGPFEIQAGRDSLWWGPGRHGSILMSNNAKPFTMIQITNPQPIQLPWIFRALGPVRGQWFLTELEKDRHVPEAKLTGVRLSVKPHPLWDLGFSRVVMFGGRGVPSVGLLTMQTAPGGQQSGTGQSDCRIRYLDAPAPERTAAIRGVAVSFAAVLRRRGGRG
jgi:hypothetical protein